MHFLIISFLRNDPVNRLKGVRVYDNGKKKDEANICSLDCVDWHQITIGNTTENGCCEIERVGVLSCEISSDDIGESIRVVYP